MLSDERLAAALAHARELEGQVREHVLDARDRAFELARGQAAYRHVVALRKSLEEWSTTRAQQARQTSSVGSGS